MTLKVRDTIAINYVHVRFTRPRATRFALAKKAQLVAGTTTAGTWRAVLTVPKGVPDGWYRLRTVTLADVGNGYATYVPGSLGAGHWPASFRVRSRPDRTPPTVTAFRVSARTVDTRTSTQTIRLRVDARDDIAGVESAFVEMHGFDRDHGPSTEGRYGINVDLVRSTAHPHRWIGTAVMPMWVGRSDWTFRVHVKDKRRHWRGLRSGDLARRGWQSTLRVISGRDTVPPSLVALTITPTSVDARDGSVRVAVTARVTDALSGPTGYGLPVDFDWAGTVLTSISGTANDRTYHGYVLVGQCGYRQQSTLPAMVSLSDWAGNVRTMSIDELDALGFPSELQVRQRDSWAPTVALAGVDVDAPLALRFSDPVIMADPLGETLRVTVNGAAASGAWECRNGSGSVVVCDADGAGVITATFAPTAAFESGDVIRLLRVSSPRRGSASTTSTACPCR